MKSHDCPEHPVVAEWIKTAKEAGACVQCQHPWHDGICSCNTGLSSTHEAKKVARTALAEIKFGNLVGKDVTYVSRAGRKYKATITGIPENPFHGDTDKPTVSLEFRDDRGKLVRKNRVLPGDDDRFIRCVWIGDDHEDVL